MNKIVSNISKDEVCWCFISDERSNENGMKNAKKKIKLNKWINNQMSKNFPIGMAGTRIAE